MWDRSADFWQISHFCKHVVIMMAWISQISHSCSQIWLIHDVRSAKLDQPFHIVLDQLSRSAQLSRLNIALLTYLLSQIVLSFDRQHVVMCISPYSLLDGDTDTWNWRWLQRLSVVGWPVYINQLCVACHAVSSEHRAWFVVRSLARQ